MTSATAHAATMRRPPQDVPCPAGDVPTHKAALPQGGDARGRMLTEDEARQMPGHKAEARWAQPMRSATTPATMESAAAPRQPVIFSPSAKTEIIIANRMEVSRSDATAAIGALVIAHMTIQ